MISIELAFISILRSDYNRATYYLKSSYRSFIERWARLHPLSTEARHAILQNLQPAVEMEEFVKLIGDDNNFFNLKSLDNALLSWKRR